MEKKKNSDIIDFSSLLQSYKNHWYLFAISILICLAGAFYYAKIKRPVYAVTSNVLIDTGENDPMNMLSMNMGGLFGSKNIVDDEIFVISSHSLYKNVAKELGLDIKRRHRLGIMNNVDVYDEYPLDIIAPPMFADTAKMAINFRVNVNEKGLATVSVKGGPNNAKLANIKDAKLPLEIKTIFGDFSLVKTKYFVPGEDMTYKFTVRGYDVAAEDLGEKISAYIANKRTNVIKISYATPDPEFGKTILNTLVAKYDERVINNKNTQSNKTLRFIDSRITGLLDDLSSLEKGIQNYKEANGLTDPTVDATYNFAFKGEIAKQLATAEGQLEVARIAREFITTPGNEYSLIPFSATDASSTGVNASIIAYNELAMKRLQLLTNARPDNPQVRNFEKQIDAMRENITVSLAKNYDTNLALVNEIRSKMGEAQSQLGKLPRQEREYLDLKRDQEIKQEIYLVLVQKREETAVMLANAISKGIVVDEAFVNSTPISISKKMILLLGLLLGLALPMIYLSIRRMLRGKPETRQEIENQVEAPILGEISTSRSGKNLVVTPNSTSSTVELFKLIRTNLQFMLKSQGSKVIMVTSSQSGEGKSFISVNTAAAFALLGKKVLIVGLDIRKPMLAQYLNLPIDHAGLTSYLSVPDMQFSAVVQHISEVPNLDVVVAGIIPPNPAELLLDPRLEQFFQIAREQYDIIIVDSAPVGMVSDSLSVADFADASIYVTRLDVTTFRDLRFINSLYTEDRLPRMSVVVNGTKTTKGYGYGYGGVEDHGKHTAHHKKSFWQKLFGK